MACIMGLIPSEMMKIAQSVAGIKQSDLQLNMEDINLSALYLMQHFHDGCHGNCAFCTQAKTNSIDKGKSYLVNRQLTRIPMDMILQNLKKGFIDKKGIERICLQTLYHGQTVENAIDTIQSIKSLSDVPISLCCIPVTREKLLRLKDTGLDTITINYECATEELFNKIRGKERNGPYHWETVERSLNEAVEIFGKFNVGTHLQIGLGETHKEALSLIQNCYDRNIFVSLFAFCPIPGTTLENVLRIQHKDFHKIQLGKYLISNKIIKMTDMHFSSSGDIVGYGIDMDELMEIIDKGIAFMNMGCSGCNRVFYETDPGQRHYSYPRNLYPDEIDIIKNEIINDMIL